LNPVKQKQREILKLGTSLPFHKFEKRSYFLINTLLNTRFWTAVSDWTIGQRGSLKDIVTKRLEYIQYSHPL
jgi:hypothetical protein